RWLGLPQSAAYVGQIAVALSAAAAVFVAWRRDGPSLLAGAVLISAALLVWPYIFDYELAILAVPLTILATDMSCRGAERWERLSLLILYFAPLLTTGIAKFTHLQLGFAELLGVLLLSCRRAFRGQRSVSLAPAARVSRG
ncbi:MAG TPA: hypothetical protein VKU60_18085, partial [Chloroflexota bacterium]|nr:hypothetical protein [Chloroflexota bacterium]